MSKPKVVYQVKGPDILPALEVWKKIADLTVVCCIPAYSDFFRVKGYTTITPKEYFSLPEDKMIFTHCLANPPFSDNSSKSSNTADLDSKFNEKSRKICKNVQMVIRTKHFTNPKSKFRKNLFASGTVVEIKFLPKETFPTILNTETCVLVTQHDHNGPATIKYPDGTIKSLVLNENTIIMSDPNYSGPVKNNLAHRWFRGKLNRKDINDDPSGIPIVEIMGTGNSPVVRNVSANVTQIGCNKHGVVMNTSANWGGLGKVFVKPFDAAITSSVICLETSSYEESEKLVEYLQSDSIKEIIKKSMAAFHPSKTLFTNIPDPFL